MRSIPAIKLEGVGGWVGARMHGTLSLRDRPLTCWIIGAMILRGRPCSVDTYPTDAKLLVVAVELGVNRHAPEVKLDLVGEEVFHAVGEDDAGAGYPQARWGGSHDHPYLARQLSDLRSDRPPRGYPIGRYVGRGDHKIKNSNGNIGPQGL